MGRFEFQVEGPELDRARAALDAAGIATVASGAHAAPAGQGRLRRGCLRSGAVPILLVVLAAFVAQRLISPAEDQPETTYNQFLEQVDDEPQAIEEVTLDTADTTIHVVERDGGAYEIGYPPSDEESLVRDLRAGDVPIVVEGGGSSLLNWVLYLLPFLLFFAIWLFIANRTRRSGDAAPAPAWHAERLTAVLDADSGDEAEARVRQSLPTGNDYRITRAGGV